MKRSPRTRLEVHHTALKHGIDPEDIVRAAAQPVWIEDLDDDLDSGNELVIHAMKARPQMLDLLP